MELLLPVEKISLVAQMIVAGGAGVARLVIHAALRLLKTALINWFTATVARVVVHSVFACTGVAEVFVVLAVLTVEHHVILIHLAKYTV